MDEGTQDKVIPVFSQEERRRIVRDFIIAYLSGTVRINFPSMEAWEQYVKTQHYEGALAKNPVETFAEHTANITGISKASPSEIETSLNLMFGLIAAFRAGKMIEGKFFEESNLERKLDALEERVGRLEGLMEELRNLMRVHRG